MKTLKYIIAGFIALASFSSCELFEMDNFDGPNAQVTGALIDKATNQTMQLEASQAVVGGYWDWGSWSWVNIYDKVGAIVVEEKGWKGTEEQDWLVRYDGTYTNNLVFAADYKVSMKKLPCYELEEGKTNITLAEGENTVNFEVTPFARIKDLAFSYDETTKKLVAKFKVELGDPTKANFISKIAFAANIQKFVGASSFNLAQNDPGASITGGLDMQTWQMVTINPDQEYTLEIDTNPEGPNAELFKYEREIFIRVGALVKNPDGAAEIYNQNNLFNLSPIYKVSKDRKNFTVATFTEE